MPSPVTCSYCLLCHADIRCPFSPSQNRILDGLPPLVDERSTVRYKRGGQASPMGKPLAMKNGRHQRPVSAPAPVARGGAHSQVQEPMLMQSAFRGRTLGDTGRIVRKGRAKSDAENADAAINLRDADGSGILEVASRRLESDENNEGPAARPVGEAAGRRTGQLDELDDLSWVGNDDVQADGAGSVSVSTPTSHAMKMIGARPATASTCTSTPHAMRRLEGDRWDKTDRGGRATTSKSTGKAPDRSKWDLPERLQGSSARRARSAMGTRADPAYVNCEYVHPDLADTLTLKISTRRKETRFFQVAAQRQASKGSMRSKGGEVFSVFGS